MPSADMDNSIAAQELDVVRVEQTSRRSVRLCDHQNLSTYQQCSRHEWAVSHSLCFQTTYSTQYSEDKLVHFKIQAAIGRRGGFADRTAFDHTDRSDLRSITDKAPCGAGCLKVQVELAIHIYNPSHTARKVALARQTTKRVIG
jgi:hypothetical protein